MRLKQDLTNVSKSISKRLEQSRANSRNDSDKNFDIKKGQGRIHSLTDDQSDIVIVNLTGIGGSDERPP